MDNDANNEKPLKHSPTDAEVREAYYENEFSIPARARRDREHLRQLSVRIKAKDDTAISELLQFASSESKRCRDAVEKIEQSDTEIDECQQLSLEFRLLAVLHEPIEHLRQNENIARDAYGIPRKRRGTGKSASTIKKHKALANRIHDYLRKGYTVAQAKQKVLEDIGDVVSLRVLERAFKDHLPEVRRERLHAEAIKISTARNGEKEQPE